VRGDFSRPLPDGDTYSRVLMQQGRVLMDADWNAAIAELLAAQRLFAADLIGPHGGPDDNLGFAITPASPNGTPDLQIGSGVYYVDGIRCVLPGAAGAQILWSEQPDPPFLADPGSPPDLPPGPYLVYLDVWERLVTSQEDESIRDVALGGPDTTARSTIVWQVRADPIDIGVEPGLQTDCATFPLGDWRALLAGHPPGLRVWVGDPSGDDEPCPVDPDSGYRGPENQLYRVEIVDVDSGQAAFAWSRENGSVAAAWVATEGTDLVIGPVPDAHRGFTAGDWVELAHDGLEAAGVAGARVRVTGVDGSALTIDPATATGPIDANPAALAHPVVRRWEQRERRGQPLRRGAVLVTEVTGDVDRQALEAGIEVQFTAPASGDPAHTYRIGDYWTFAARVATGTVEWPVTGPDRVPVALPPHGPAHLYAPLVRVDADGTVTDLRHEFAGRAACRAL
jgi:Family of unknown function (DUF6519)